MDNRKTEEAGTAPVDIRNYDEAIRAIVSHMEYPETEEEKKAFFIRFYEFAVAEM